MLNLKTIRKQKQLTQADMATFLGVSRPAYTRYENGEREPDNATLNKIADYFNVTTDYLLGREEKDTKKVRSSEDERTLQLLDEYPEVGTIVDIMAKLPLSAQKELAEYAKFRADQLEKEHQK